MEFNLKQAVSYYTNIVFDVGSAGGPPVGNKDDDLRLSKLVYEYLSPKVCGENPTTSVDVYTAGMLSAVYANRFPEQAKIYPSANQYNELLRKLEPEAFEKQERNSYVTNAEWRSDKEGYKHLFAAGDVCLAMKADGVLR